VPRTVLFALVVAGSTLTGCAGSGLTPPVVDNPDALDDIPAPPPTVPRDEADNPYDEQDPADPPQDDPADDPADDPSDPADTQDDPADNPSQPADPPDDPADPTDPADPLDPCPAGVICVDSFPFVESNTTTGGVSNFDSYGCDWGIDESGPEVVYQLEIDEPGFLAVTLFGMSGTTDVDAHLLGALDNGDCIDRGHWEAASLVQPGTYFVVADSWVDSGGTAHDGDYSIRMQHTGFDAFAGDGLRPHVMEDALTIFDTAWHGADTSRLLYTVADFTLPSYEPRQWTFDLATGDLLYALHVTHGSGGQDPNDPAMVAQMSNISGSHMSSVGLMRTAETYYGSWGYSMRLDGLEPGHNDLVRPRAIVIHPADYATPAFVAQNGYLGRSWGCPAVDPAFSADLIDTIKNGTLFLSYFDDTSWMNTSTYR
jgi:hypothetical protein